MAISSNPFFGNWVYPDAIGGWNQGEAYTTWQGYFEWLKSLKPDSWLGGNFGSQLAGEKGYTWSQNVWFRYEWQSSFFRPPGYMAVWFSTDNGKTWKALS